MPDLLENCIPGILQATHKAFGRPESYPAAPTRGILSNSSSAIFSFAEQNRDTLKHKVRTYELLKYFLISVNH